MAWEGEGNADFKFQVERWRDFGDFRGTCCTKTMRDTPESCPQCLKMRESAISAVVSMRSLLEFSIEAWSSRVARHLGCSTALRTSAEPSL